ncbi:DUF7010 family protein [Idiomarina sp. UBA4520]|jgi:hypothetical protein|uniref:DUF7010 family protein n=1 Tax=Idiomarina sp. UBA4520 TaxID=1946647 RepID=UPI000A55DF37|nr:hypothetical protein [Idiomarina sp. UBA4520]MBF39251.1 hypothetical protein [Idiomarinaceae bacterium]|tara:strand:+ start:31724 stop:32287 length:564 start_codon:yes stop_codon:yes gene_type:complete
MNQERSLEVQREEFKQRRLLATPLSGLIAWCIIAASSLFLEPFPLSLVTFIATGSIVYLALFLSKFTGENMLDKSKPKNTFDKLFMLTVLMSASVYSIAIPFFLEDYTSLPLAIGVLTGLMWIPISWIIQHWIGIAHGLARTILVVAAWYAFPEHRFLAVSLVIVALYVFAITVLEIRWRKLKRESS